MINDILIACSHNFALWFGVDDGDSMVKSVTVDATEGVGEYADLKLFESDGQTIVYSNRFLNDGHVTTVQLAANEQLPYTIETVTVPATGEEVQNMSGPQYSFG